MSEGSISKFAFEIGRCEFDQIAHGQERRLRFAYLTDDRLAGGHVLLPDRWKVDAVVVGHVGDLDPDSFPLFHDGIPTGGRSAFFD